MSLRDGKRSGGLLNRLGIECVESGIRRGRLRWFGRVERGEESGWVKKCAGVGVIGVVDGGAPGGAWRGCVGRDVGAVGVRGGGGAGPLCLEKYYWGSDPC